METDKSGACIGIFTDNTHGTWIVVGKQSKRPPPPFTETLHYLIAAFSGCHSTLLAPLYSIGLQSNQMKVV